MDRPARCLLAMYAMLLAIVFAPGTSVAAVVPVTDVVISLNARDQAVSEFMETLFNEMNVPLVINGDLAGIVTGKFKGTANEIMEKVSVAFDVIIYFDGAVAHVYPSNRLIRRILPMTSSDARRVRGLVERTELGDQQNKVEREDGGLLLTGVPRFIEQVEEFIDLVKDSKEVKIASKATGDGNSNYSGANNNTKQARPKPKAAEYVYRVFKLKHAWAEDITYTIGSRSVVVPGISSLLRDLVFKQGAAPSTRVAKTNTDTVTGLRGSGLASNGVAENIKLDESGIPVERTGVVRIISDSRINAVIVSDLKDRIDGYETLIKSLDIPVEMVEIEATIIDINSDRSMELGVDWRAALGDNSTSFTNGYEDPFNALSQGGVLSLVSTEGLEFMARVRALEQQGAARVVSKPHIITLSNVEGVLGRTSEFFVRIAGEEEVDLFNVPVGTTLRVKPHVFQDNNLTKVKMIININDGSQSATGAVVDEIPVVERATISTQAVIVDGDSLLLGGLARESFGRREYGIPILGSIPFVGRLFRDTSDSTSRIERLFLITPRVVKNVPSESKADIPRLIGDDIEGFLSDSRRSLDSVEWPEERDQSLWPVGKKPEKNILASAELYENKTMIASNDPMESVLIDAHTSRKSTKQNLDYTSPFTVEYWAPAE